MFANKLEHLWRTWKSIKTTIWELSLLTIPILSSMYCRNLVLSKFKLKDSSGVSTIIPNKLTCCIIVSIVDDDKDLTQSRVRCITVENKNNVSLILKTMIFIFCFEKFLNFTIHFCFPVLQTNIISESQELRKRLHKNASSFQIETSIVKKCLCVSYQIKGTGA